MKCGRESRAGSHASRAGKPLRAVAAYRDGAPLVSAQLCPGTVYSETLLCHVSHAPHTPDMAVHDHAAPPWLALWGWVTPGRRPDATSTTSAPVARQPARPRLAARARPPRSPPRGLPGGGDAPPRSPCRGALAAPAGRPSPPRVDRRHDRALPPPHRRDRHRCSLWPHRRLLRSRPPATAPL